MIKLNASVCIDASAPAVWARLAKLEDIQLWSEPILQASCDGTLAQGVGAERTCRLAGNLTIQERWIAWDEGHSFQYEGFGIPLVKRVTNHWSVQPQGARSLLISAVEMELKGGFLGRTFEPIMRLMAQRMAPNALAGFKYLVEHGHPYPGKQSELPRVSALC